MIQTFIDMCYHCRTTTKAPTGKYYVKVTLQYLILSSLSILYLFEIFISVCFF